jgi:hypothetical protein
MAGQGQCEPGFAAPGEHSAGGDVLPLRFPRVEDQQQPGWVGGDVHVDPARAGRVDVQLPGPECPDVSGLAAQAQLEAGGEALDAVGPDPSGQDGIEAFDDEGGVGWVDRPGPPEGPGYVMPVDHQLAQQDAQRGIGPYLLAAVEPEGRHLVP